MTTTTRTFIHGSTINGEIRFHDFTTAQIDEIILILEDMVSTTSGKNIFENGFFNSLRLDFHNVNTGSQGGVSTNERGQITALRFRLDYNDVNAELFLNENGVVEGVQLDRLVIHESIHALSGLTIGDDHDPNLMTSNPNFMGSTVELSDVSAYGTDLSLG